MSKSILKQFTREELQEELNRRITDQAGKRGYEMLIRDVVTALTARVFGIERQLILTRCRAARVSDAKTALATLLRRKYNLSYPALGQILQMDHSSVIHLINNRHPKVIGRGDYAISFERLSSVLPPTLESLMNTPAQDLEVNDLRVAFVVEEHEDGKFTYRSDELKLLRRAVDPAVLALAESIHLELSGALANTCLARNTTPVINSYTVRLVQCVNDTWRLETHRPLRKDDVSPKMEEIRNIMDNITNGLVR